MERDAPHRIGDPVRLEWTGEVPPVGIETIGFSQAHPHAERKPYFLYEHDAEPDNQVEVQWEDSHHAAVESFLLPGLRITTPYPPHSRETNLPAPPRLVFWDYPRREPSAVESHIDDPYSLLPPLLLALAGGGDAAVKRYAVGVADWPEDVPYRQRDVWQDLDPHQMRIKAAWRGLARELETL